MRGFYVSGGGKVGKREEGVVGPGKEAAFRRAIQKR